VEAAAARAADLDAALAAENAVWPREKTYLEADLVAAGQGLAGRALPPDLSYAVIGPPIIVS
jgi:hypothetical protein